MPKRTRTKSLQLTWFGPEIAATVEKSMEPGLFAMGDTVLDRAKARAPRRSGLLRESGFVATARRTSYVQRPRDRRRKEMTRIMGGVGPKQALVGFASWFSNLLEDTGAKPHVIPYQARTNRARRRKTLQIPGVGFRKRVTHPGMRSQPFLGPALDGAKKEGAEAFAAEVRRRLEAMR